MQERTLAQIVENFYVRGVETAYVHRRGYRTVRWSYRQIADSSRQLARALAAKGISSGDRVMIWGDDCPEWVIGFLGCVLRGAVVVPMDRTASLGFSERVFRQTNAKLCIGSAALIGSNRQYPGLSFESLPELALISQEPIEIPELRSDDVAEIVFTSGTTAEPKGVVLTHRNILANLEPLEREISKYLKYERIFHPLRFLNLLPLSHVFGQFLGLFLPQILGSTVIFQNSLSPAEIIRTIKKERASVLVAVPRVLEAMRDKLERDQQANGNLLAFQRALDLASSERFLKRWWRFRRIHQQFGWKFWALISGGASLSPEIEQFWSRLGFAVVQGYGLTETTSLISLNHPLKIGKGSIGKVLPGREIRLSQDGEILVRGESIARSYLERGELKPVAGEEGWFRTGDIGALDEHGNLYFKGRRKNVIVTAEGMNVYPEDLEAALRLQPEIRDCVVIALKREGNAEPCAVIIPRAQDKRLEPAIRRANTSLSNSQQIRNWLNWPEEDFPRTATQKPHLRAIEEYAQSYFAGAAAAGTESGLLSGLIRSVTGRPAKISARMRPEEELNLSSIEKIELLCALEDRLQLELEESAFASARTVGELEAILSRPVQQASDFSYPRWSQSVPITGLRTLVYSLLVWPATYLLARPGIRGRENLNQLNGPVLFVSNHVTQVDIGFILAALPYKFRHRIAVAMNGEMLRAMRNPPRQAGVAGRMRAKISYGLLVALFNVFPLPQKSGYRESFAFAGDLADRGWSIVVFPEGTRTSDGQMNPFRPGIGILASSLDIPIVPIRLDGLFELKKNRRRAARPGTVRVSIGAAVRYGSGMAAAEIAHDLQARILRMETRGL